MHGTDPMMTATFRRIARMAALAALLPAAALAQSPSTPGPAPQVPPSQAVIPAPQPAEPAPTTETPPPATEAVPQTGAEVPPSGEAAPAEPATDAPVALPPEQRSGITGLRRTPNAPPPAQERTFEDKQVAVLQGLDKITARTSTFTVPVGGVNQFGQLSVTVRACRKAPPVDPPESAAFVEIVERKQGEEPKGHFSGWMFASSPALSAMEHPVYDVWVIDCRNESTSSASDTPQ